MSHTVGGVTTSYSWDVDSGLPVMLQDGTNSYVYGRDLISATDGSGIQTYFLYDGLGSTTGLTDGSGNNPVSYSYDVFGAIRAQTGTSGNNWLFTGEQRDSDSNSYYLRARYYDPAIGRFVTRDPLAGSSRRPSTQNRYAYVENNPLNRFDPYGLCCSISDITDTLSDATDVVGSRVVTATNATANFVSNPNDLAGTVQFVSGIVIALSCGPQDAVIIPSGAVCGAALGAYGLATLAKVLLADSDCERGLAFATGVLGAYTGPGGKAVAAFSGALAGVGCPSPVYASSVGGNTNMGGHTKE